MRARSSRWAALAAAVAVAASATAVGAPPVAAAVVPDVSWLALSPAPSARAEAPTAFVAGKLHVFAGYLTFNPPTYATTSMTYDPATDSWTTDAVAPPFQLAHAATAVVDDRYVYVAGGQSPSPTRLCGTSPCSVWATTNVWRYDAWSSSWAAGPPLPQAREAGTLVLVGRALHFLGGNDKQRVDQADHWTLDVDAGTSWQTATPLPSPRNRLGGAVVGSTLYVMGGQLGSKFTQIVLLNSVLALDLATPGAPWTTLAPMPGARSHLELSAVAVGTDLLVAAGDNPVNRGTATLYRFDTTVGTWKVLPTRLPRATYSSAFLFDGTGLWYVAGAPVGGGQSAYRGTIG